jgi:hypothetical protein
MEQGASAGTFDRPFKLSKGWEHEVRSLAADQAVSAYFSSLAMDLHGLAGRVVDSVKCALAGQPLGVSLPTAYVAISGLSSGPLESAFEEAKRTAGIAGERPAKDNLHVTLWHAADVEMKGAPGHGAHFAAGQSLMQHQGQQATVEVLSFDLAEDIMAARVILLSGPVGTSEKAYLHITMWHATGVEAKFSNDLPRRIQQGTAQRVPVGDALEVHGIVTCHFQ